MNNTPRMVALATEDEDLGMVAAADADQHAKEYANEQGCTVYLRDPLTDEVLSEVNPA